MIGIDNIYARGRAGARPSGVAIAIGQLTAGMTHEERLAQVQWLARMMDDQFAIPGTSFRFGWDSILGLVPGFGDAITSALSLLIVHHAWQTGASPITLGRMLSNIGIDFLVGAVPLVGDAFDVLWKANRKNARLLENHLRRQNPRHLHIPR